MDPNYRRVRPPPSCVPRELERHALGVCRPGHVGEDSDIPRLNGRRGWGRARYPHPMGV